MAELIKELGTVIAKSTGDGLYARGVKKSVALTLVATIDPDEIERDADGKIVYAYCTFVAKFSADQWDVKTLGGERSGDMYTDNGIERCVNRYLATLGFVGTVGWSEAGRQEDTVADFDMSYSLIEQFWPDLKS